MENVYRPTKKYSYKYPQVFFPATAISGNGLLFFYANQILANENNKLNAAFNIQVVCSEQPTLTGSNKFIDQQNRNWVVDGPIWGEGDSTNYEAELYYNGDFCVLATQFYGRNYGKVIGKTLLIQDEDKFDATLLLEEQQKITNQILSTFKFFTPTDTQVPNDWKTFISNRYGFSVKYPGFLYQNTCNPDNLDLNEKPTNDCGSERLPIIYIQNITQDYGEEKTTAVYLEEIKQDYNISEKQVVVAGQNVLQVIGTAKTDKSQTESGMGYHYLGIWTFIEKNNPDNKKSLFLIKYYKIQSNNKDYSDIYNQILSTFKFLE